MRQVEILEKFHNIWKDADHEYIEIDELLEVTPKSIRMRKKILDQVERKRASR